MGDKTFHELLEEEQAEAEGMIATELSKPKDVQRTKVMGEEDFYKNLTEKAGKPLPHSELNPDAGVTGKGMINTAAEENLDLFKQRFRQLDECTNTACSNGNYDVNEYMRGMANGLILARAIMNDDEPEYIPAPETDSKEEKAFKVITLCGSSRFPQAFNLANMHLSLKGHTVLSLSCFGHADKPEGAKFLTSDGNEEVREKKILDQVHFRKIDISDEVLVINVGGYIGSSTEREIAYAHSKGKKVRYMFNSLTE